MSPYRKLAASWLMLALLGSVVYAQAEPKADGEVSRLVRQLDAEEFRLREEATRELTELGQTALLALEIAAQGDSREAASRAMSILKLHFQKGAPELKEVVRECLARIAKGPSAAAARHAEEIIAPPTSPFVGRPVVLPAPAPGVLPPRVALGGGIARRISIKTVNGVKDVNVEEGARKIRIQDDPAKGIEMEVTDKKDGKEATEKYAAKNADDLKEKHPEAHKLYEQYARGRVEDPRHLAELFRARAAAAIAAAKKAPLPAPAKAAEPAPPADIPVRLPEEAARRLREAPVIPPLKVRTIDQEKQLAEKLNAAIKDLDAAIAQLGAFEAAEDRVRAQESLEAAKRRLDELKTKLAE